MPCRMLALPSQPHLNNADGLSGHVITDIDEEGDQQDEATEPGGERASTVCRGPATAPSRPQHQPLGSLLDPSSQGKGQEYLRANWLPSFQPLALLGSYCSKAVSVSGYVEQLWPQGIESFSKHLK